MIASNQRTYNIYSFAFVIVVEHVSSISVKQSATAYIWIIHIEVNFFVFIIHAIVSSGVRMSTIFAHDASRSNDDLFDVDFDLVQCTATTCTVLNDRFLHKLRFIVLH